MSVSVCYSAGLGVADLLPLPATSPAARRDDRPDSPAPARTPGPAPQCSPLGSTATCGRRYGTASE